MTKDRPRSPVPEEFGLSPARILEFEGFARYMAVCGWSIPIIFCGIALWVYSPGRPVFEWLLHAGIVGAVTCLPGGAAIAFVVNWFWRLLQKDHGKYRLFSKAKEQYEAQLAEWLKTQVDWWRRLSGRAFELNLAGLLREHGFGVQVVGGAGDGGIDLLVETNARRIAVQCKAHSRPIGPGAVRDFYGALIHSGVAEGWVVSTFGFSQSARAFATGKPVRLIAIGDLLNEYCRK